MQAMVDGHEEVVNLLQTRATTSKQGARAVSETS